MNPKSRDSIFQTYEIDAVWVAKSLYISLIFTLIGCGVGIYWRTSMPLGVKSLNEFVEFVGNPSQKAVEYLLEIFAAVIVLGLCALVKDYIHGFLDKVVDISHEEFGNMWRITCGTLMSFCCGTFILIFLNKEIKDANDISTANHLLFQSAIFYIISFMLCFIPSLFLLKLKKRISQK